jgi:hemolysin III
MPTSTSVTVLRDLTRHELAADCIIHILGIAGGSIGGATLVALIAARGDWLELGALLIYAVGIVAMFGCSAAYNHWRARALAGGLPAVRPCRHLVMIAGTCTLHPAATGRD